MSKTPLTGPSTTPPLHPSGVSQLFNPMYPLETISDGRLRQTWAPTLAGIAALRDVCAACSREPFVIYKTDLASLDFSEARSQIGARMGGRSVLEMNAGALAASGQDVRDRSGVGAPCQLRGFERRICPKRTRSRGRRTRPRFRRIDGFRAREHGKDQIAVSASNLGESGLAHPRELLADGCGQVMFHPLNRGIEVTLADLQLACALDPHLARALIDSRGVSPPTWSALMKTPPEVRYLKMSAKR